MNRVFIPGLLLVALGLFAGGAIGGLWYAKRLDPTVASGAVSTPATNPSAATGAKPLTSTGDKPGTSAVTVDSVRQLLLLLDPAQRKALLADAQKFQQFVAQEAEAQAVLAAARANALDRNEAVQQLMQRAGDKVLADTYLREVVRRNLDPKFPNEQQISDFYTKNPELFTLPERVHLWQIFIPMTAGDSAEKKEQARTLSRQILEQLKGGKADFATLAAKYSKHGASRINDGYMGLVRLDELVPQVKEAVAKLGEGMISRPLETPDGIHILKRGVSVKGSLVGLDEVRPQVIARLQRDASAEVRQAAIKKVMATYPVSPAEAAVDTWREQLNAKEWPAAAAATADPTSP